MSRAVRVGHVLKQAQAVEDIVLDHVVVGQDVLVREAQALRPADEVRIDRLAGFLRLDVYGVRRVHAAGGYAHDHALVTDEQFPQTDCLEEGVLRRDVPARKENDITGCHELVGTLHIAAIKHIHLAEAHAVPSEASGEGLRHLVIAGMIIWPSGNHQESSAGRDIFAQICNKFIAFKINTGQLAALGNIVITGAGGQEEGHHAAPFQISIVLFYPDIGGLSRQEAWGIMEAANTYVSPRRNPTWTRPSIQVTGSAFTPR